MTVVVILVMLIGLFLISGGIFNWDFLMKKDNLPLPFEFLPRQAARVMMCLLGLLLFIGGVMIGLGR